MGSTPTRATILYNDWITPPMKRYTLGFIFNSTLTKVLLIHKLTPEWQKGRVNGIGGKTEQGEDSLSCIVREIHEETGLVTQRNKWVYVSNLESDEWTMDVFGLVYTGDTKNAKSTDKEIVEWFDINNLPSNIMSNGKWLIPLTLDKIKNNNFNIAKVEYK